ANRTRGMVVAGDDGKSAFRGFGRTVSGRTFGHMGAGGQVAWADPETGLSFCYLTNGVDADLLRSGRRGTSLSSKAGICVASPGGRREFGELISDIASHQLDRRRPLWELWVVEGLEHGHIGVVAKIHHAAADGVAAAAMLANALGVGDSGFEEVDTWHPDPIP